MPELKVHIIDHPGESTVIHLIYDGKICEAICSDHGKILSMAEWIKQTTTIYKEWFWEWERCDTCVPQHIDAYEEALNDLSHIDHEEFRGVNHSQQGGTVMPKYEEPNAFCTVHTHTNNWWGEIRYSANSKTQQENDLGPGAIIGSDICIPVSDEGRECMHNLLEEFLDNTAETGRGMFYIGDPYSPLLPEYIFTLLKESIEKFYAPRLNGQFVDDIEKELFEARLKTLIKMVEEAEKRSDDLARRTW
jgi:hypothetical protein